MLNCFTDIFANKTRSLVTFVLLYVVIFHVMYNNYWKALSNKSATLGQLWRTWISDETGEQYEDSGSLDIHIEDPAFGHSGETSERDDVRRSHRSRQPGSNSIAIGGGITSKNIGNLNITNIAGKFQLFDVFMPTFCQTATDGFDYNFYLAFDSTDAHFRDSNFVWAFQKTFLKVVGETCSTNVTVSLHMVQCSHAGRPTWAQNDAMLEAYLDNVEYYYRINDDTKMLTKNWTDRFIEVLRKYDPTKVGVVGPNHSGGNTAILTYDFVHRTHVDIFGFYYPRLFTDWWGDDWVTRVYRPDRSTKLGDIHLAHTLNLGQRYGVRSGGVGHALEGQLKEDTAILLRYINYIRTKDSVKVDGKKVISMSLYGKDPRHTWGAIRNAQLLPILFPGWKLRIYVTSRGSRAPAVKTWLVPKRILRKLKQLGAELAYVKTNIPPVFWRYLVVDDSGVDYFLVRNAHSRLSERDATVVNEWLEHAKKENRTALHCIRDHPKHANLSIVDGLWGGDCAAVRRILDHNMAGLLDTFHSNQINTKYSSSSSSAFLSDVLWPRLSSSSFCHDSVTCENWTINKYLFPIERKNGDEYLGQEFDRHHRLISVDGEKLMNVTLKCRPTKYFKTSVETTTLQNNQSIAQ